MLHEVERALEAAEIAQKAWADQVPRHRLKAISKIASQIPLMMDELLQSLNRPNASDAEKLATEILPLADACRHTSQTARHVLAPRSTSSLRGAWWMGRIAVTTTRQPWGIILILAPANYPLFIPGVQMVQALAAGNAVVVKPAPHCELVLDTLKRGLVAAGIPADLVQILPSSVEAGEAAIQHGVDKVVLTGSRQTGRAVLHQLADTLTPSIMELSGCDAVFVLPQADVSRVAKAIAYALRLNGGATCIAPRRVFVTQANVDALRQALVDELMAVAPQMMVVTARAATVARRVVELAIRQGARIVTGQCSSDPLQHQMQPMVLDGVQPEMEVARTDVLAPITSLIVVNDMQAALAADRLCPFSLCASIFGPTTYAEHWAQRIEAGCVVVNDIVVPTADPRVSFGGRDHSGWGLTRGTEGLIEMTCAKTICYRKGNWLPHLDKDNANDAEMLTQMLRLFHSGTWRGRLQAVRTILQRVRMKNKPVHPGQS